MGINKPYVSVVISTYNRKDMLAKTIKSLLNQTYKKSRYEIIVVDDGSTDGTYKIVKEEMKDALCEIRYLYQENRGLPSARNRGIKAANGEIIAFTDDDCVVDQQWLEFLVQKFSEAERVGGVRGKVITDKVPAIYLTDVVPIDPSGHKYVGANIAYCKKDLELVGFFDERFSRTFRDDSDIAYRILKSGKRILYASNAVVYHPIKKLDFIGIIKSAFAHEADVLLHSKHPEIPKDVLGSTLTQPLLRSFSLVGLVLPLFFTCLLIAIFFLSLAEVLGVLVILLSSWTVVFIAFGYRFVSSPRCFGKITSKLRLKNTLAILVYLFVLTLARMYGTMKYKHFFV